MMMMSLRLLIVILCCFLSATTRAQAEEPTLEAENLFDSAACKTCVEQGYTYCMPTGNSTSMDFCSSSNECGWVFESFESKWDCEFETEDGAGVLAVLILFPILFCCCCAGCCTCCYYVIKRNQEYRREPNNPTSTIMATTPAQTYNASNQQYSSSTTTPVVAAPLVTTSTTGAKPYASAKCALYMSTPDTTTSTPAVNPDYQSEREPEISVLPNVSDQMMKELQS